jgi:hypothetical protein
MIFFEFLDETFSGQFFPLLFTVDPEFRNCSVGGRAVLSTVLSFSYLFAALFVQKLI